MWICKRRFCERTRGLGGGGKPWALFLLLFLSSIVAPNHVAFTEGLNSLCLSPSDWWDFCSVCPVAALDDSHCITATIAWFTPLGLLQSECSRGTSCSMKREGKGNAPAVDGVAEVNLAKERQTTTRKPVNQWRSLAVSIRCVKLLHGLICREGEKKTTHKQEGHRCVFSWGKKKKKNEKANDYLFVCCLCLLLACWWGRAKTHAVRKRLPCMFGPGRTWPECCAGVCRVLLGGMRRPCKATAWGGSSPWPTYNRPWWRLRRLGYGTWINQPFMKGALFCC